MNDYDEFNPYGHDKGPLIPASIARRTDLNNADKMVYGCLRWHCGKKGLVCPSLKQMARELGMSKASVNRAVGVLEAKKLIKATKPSDLQKSQYWHTTYAFLWQPDFNEKPTYDDGKASTAGGTPPVSGRYTPVPPAERLNTCHSITSHKETPLPPANTGGSGRGKKSSFDKEFYPTAQKLASTIQKIKNVNYMPECAMWANVFSQLSKETGGGAAEVKATVATYCDLLPSQIKNEFFPKAYNAGEFKARYIRIRDAIQKATNGSPPITKSQSNQNPNVLRYDE